MFKVQYFVSEFYSVRSCKNNYGSFLVMCVGLQNEIGTRQDQVGRSCSFFTECFWDVD